MKEMLLPWVVDNHWTLLVFQFDKVLHFDSFDSECHFPLGRHSNFVQMVCQAWQTLREVQVYDCLVVSQQVPQQPGNYECGDHTLRNAMLYLKVIPHCNIYCLKFCLYFMQCLTVSHINKLIAMDGSFGHFGTETGNQSSPQS